MYFTSFDAIPRHHYSTILADCPWSYSDKMNDRASFSVVGQYPTMRVPDIKALPVADIATKDAVLFMWVTSPMLPVGLEVMQEWGFDFKTVAFCWTKQTAAGRDCVNLGRWTLGNVELCLLGARGKPQRVSRTVRQLVRAVREGHSVKPGEVRDRIRQLMGDGSAIELFARGNPPVGWDAWGNEPNEAAQ